MPDITILRSGETMISQVSGETDRAVEFIDAYYPKRKEANCTVVDSGRILLENQDVREFVAEAQAALDGLDLEYEEGL